MGLKSAIIVCFLLCFVISLTFQSTEHEDKKKCSHVEELVGILKSSLIEARANLARIEEGLKLSKENLEKKRMEWEEYKKKEQEEMNSMLKLLDAIESKMKKLEEANSRNGPMVSQMVELIERIRQSLLERLRDLDLQNPLAEMETHIKILEKKRADVLKLIEELEGELEKAIQDLRELRYLQDEEKRVGKRIADLKKILEEKEKIVSDLMRDVAELEGELAGIESECQKLTPKVFDDFMDELQGVLKLLEMITEMHGDGQISEDSFGKLHSILSSIHDRIKKSVEKRIEEAQRKYEKCRDRLNKMNEEYLRKKLELEGVMSEIENLKKQIAALETRLAAIREMFRCVF